MTFAARTALLAAATVLALAACSTTTGTRSSAGAPPAEVGGPMAKSMARSGSVNLAAASGSLVSGTLQLLPTDAGVRITGEVGGLAAGSTHGFHIHEKGDCSAADATSAGGHFNPAAKPHGRGGAGPHHAGDFDNIVANGEGVAKVDVVDGDITLGGGAANDISGRAFVVHAGADDYTSQPAGDAGKRVACGVVKAMM